MTYNGFIGSVDYDIDDEILFGKILHVNDTVTFESTTITGLKNEFKSAVDDYLATCQQIGKEPQKSFKGSFNIRLGESLHRKVAIAAAKQDITINDYIKNAVSARLSIDKVDRLVRKIEITENPEISFISIRKTAAIAEEAVVPGEKAFDFSFSDVGNNVPRIQ